MHLDLFSLEDHSRIILQPMTIYNSGHMSYDYESNVSEMDTCCHLFCCFCVAVVIFLLLLSCYKLLLWTWPWRTDILLWWLLWYISWQNRSINFDGGCCCYKLLLYIYVSTGTLSANVSPECWLTSVPAIFWHSGMTIFSKGHAEFLPWI